MRSLARSMLLCPLLAACASAPGEPVALDALAADLATHDVVFLGEDHDNDVGHLKHLQILKLLHAQRDDLVLSLEMFERDVQERLDAYLAGEIDEATFLAESRPWPNYRTHYRPMVEYARTRGLPVIAANVPRPLAQEVRSKGIEAAAGNPHAAREVSAPRDAYWDAFRAAMAGHGGADDSTMERYYEAQCLKDDTMAESIVDVLRSREPRPLVVHVTGKFHCEDGLGTAARVRSRLPDAEIAVVSMETGPAAFRTGDSAWLLRVPPQPSIDVVPPKADAPAADDGAEPEPAGPSGRPALGFMPNYDAAVDGVLVDMLVSGGPAETAGVREGDVIVEVGDRQVEDVHGYMAVLADLMVGQEVEVVVVRDGEEKTLRVKVGQRGH